MTEPMKPAYKETSTPCPDGCIAPEVWFTPKDPEMLRVNQDGEIYCPGCWEKFGQEAPDE